MPDIRRERCELMVESLSAIEDYMQGIRSASNFIQSPEGRLRLDGITLRLQVIGENIKQMKSLYPSFFETDLPYDVDEIVRFRDFISHHYEKLDYQIIYETVMNHLPGLNNAIQTYLNLSPSE